MIEPNCLSDLDRNQVLKVRKSLGCDEEGERCPERDDEQEFKPSTPGADAWRMRNYWSHIGPFYALLNRRHRTEKKQQEQGAG